MDLFLQIWGGGFYLFNKILFVVSEGKEAQLKRKVKIAAWVIYILGVPPWIIILFGQQNWIAGSIEIGGIPAMLLGLYNAYHDDKKRNRVFNSVVAFSTYSSIVFGVAYSLNHNGGLTSITQFFEITTTIGFLLGSYFLARNDTRGWLFFMLMNSSMASLMFLQDKHILMAQQLVSLCFVIYGYTRTIAK